MEGSVLNLQRTSRDSEAEGPAWQNHHSGLRSLECWLQARWVWHGKGVLSESLVLTHCWGWIPGSPALVCLHLYSSCPASQLSFECIADACALNVSATIYEHHDISSSAVDISRTALQALTGFVGGS